MLKKLCAMTLGAALLLFVAQSATAQDASAADTGTDAASTAPRPRTEYRAEVQKQIGEQRQLRQDTRADLKSKNDALRDENKQLKDGPKSNKDQIKANRAEMKENRSDAKNTVREGRIETKEELQKARETRNAALKERLETRKAEAAEKLSDREAAVKAKKKQLEEKRKGKKEVLEAKKKENIERFISNRISEFDKAIERLREFETRLSSHIEKFETEGKNVSAAKEKLLAAKIAIDAAEAKVKDAALISVEVTEGETPKSAFERVRSSLQKTKESLKQAHAALVEVTKALKATDSETETSSNATTNQ